MGFFALLLNRELAPAAVASALGRLFALDAASVAEVTSGSSSPLYYDLHVLEPAKAPRNVDPAALFDVHLCVYPHPSLSAVFESERAFALAFSREVQLPVLVDDSDAGNPFRFLLFEEDAVHEVDECHEDGEYTAITVNLANKKPLPPH
jgi:hypothetical protein